MGDAIISSCTFHESKFISQSEVAWLTAVLSEIISGPFMTANELPKSVTCARAMLRLTASGVALGIVYRPRASVVDSTTVP